MGAEGVCPTVGQQVFEFRRLPATTYEYDVDTWTMLDVTIERDRDASIITRRGYYLPDVLADLGGITVLLYVLFSFLVGLWTNKYLERYMVSKLFRVKRDEEGEVDPENKHLST